MRRDDERRHGDHDQQNVTQYCRQRHVRAHHIEHDAGLPQPAHQHQADDGQQQHEVHLAFDADAPRIRRRILSDRQFLFPIQIVVTIDYVEQRQQQHPHEDRLGQDVAHGPEEVHALQKTKEQRWIAERRQRAACVCHEEDEEHDDMRHMPAIVVGTQQRPDQQHRRAGGAHDAGQQRAQRENAGVQLWRAMQVAAHADTTRHHI